jgi:hypothetical protein
MVLVMCSEAAENSVISSRLIAAFLISLTSVAAHAAAQSAIPELAGVWGRNTLEYGQPATGPGPIKNIGVRMTMGDYRDPILKPWAAEVVKKMGEISKTGEAFPTAHNQCWPEPPPYIFGNRETQILQLKDKVLLIYAHGSQVRTIRLNSAHPAKLNPSWYGDSIGHYEGDALVVDTTGIKVAPLSTVDRYGTPHTDALHLIERYSLIDPASTTAEARRVAGGFGRTEADDVIDRNYKGKALQISFTVEDPGAFNMPWSGIVVARRAKDLLMEDVCVEQIHDYVTGKDTDVPKSKTGLLTGE